MLASANDNKRFQGTLEVLRLALPTSAGMLNATILQFLDAFLIAMFVGPEALSAQFVAGIYAFVPISFCSGVVSVVNTYVSQNYGAGRLKQCGQYTWQGLYLAVLGGLLVMPLALGSNGLFNLLAHTIKISGGAVTPAYEIQLQAMYFRYMVAGAMLTVGARVMEQFFYGTGRAGVVYVVSTISVAVNLLLAYALIPGKWGFPAMGLEGAAIATMIGWAISVLLPLGLFLSRSNAAKYCTRRAWQFRPKMLLDLLKIGWPAGLQFCNDIAAWGVFISFAVGFFGPIHTAASTIVMRYLHVSFMPAIGVSIACTALVGRYIGQGRPDLARKRAHAGLIIAIVYMGLCGLCFLLFRRQLVGVFLRSNGEMTELIRQGLSRPEDLSEILRIGSAIFLCAAAFQVFDALGIVFIGSLRGAGDTLAPMLVTLVLSWTLVVGAGLACVKYLPQLTSIGPWIVASLYVTVLGLIMAWRFESGAWRKFNLLGQPTTSCLPEEAGVPADLSGPLVGTRTASTTEDTESTEKREA